MLTLLHTNGLREGDKTLLNSLFFKSKNTLTSFGGKVQNLILSNQTLGNKKRQFKENLNYVKNGVNRFFSHINSWEQLSNSKNIINSIKISFDITQDWIDTAISYLKKVKSKYFDLANNVGSTMKKFGSVVSLISNFVSLSNQLKDTDLSFEERYELSKTSFNIIKDSYTLAGEALNFFGKGSATFRRVFSKFGSLLRAGELAFTIFDFGKNFKNAIEINTEFGGNALFTTLTNAVIGIISVAIPGIGAFVGIAYGLLQGLLSLWKTDNGYSVWQNINDHGMNDYWYNFREKSRRFSEHLRLISKDFHDPIRIYVTDHAVHEPVIRMYNIGSESDRRSIYYCGEGTCGNKHNLDIYDEGGVILINGSGGLFGIFG